MSRNDVFAYRARYAWYALLENVRTDDGRHLRERIPPQPGDHPATYLWGYAAALTASAAMVGMDPRDPRELAELERLLAGLDDYWAPERKPPAYRTTVRGTAEDERFYDDNAWVALALLEAYRLLGREELLHRAMDLFDFIRSGADAAMGGGIYWKEGDPSTKNTCSNGPAVVLALELWQATGDRSCLDWARPIYAWIRRHLQSPAGVYWDRIERDGRIDKTTWTYNTGIMIQAAALWYGIEGDPGELDEARRLARVSLAHFAPERWHGAPVFPPTPWFNSILYHGYEALYRIDNDPSYLEALAAALDCAWREARDTRGLVHRDWTGRMLRTHEPFPLLDMAPVAELWARLSVVLPGPLRQPAP